MKHLLSFAAFLLLLAACRKKDSDHAQSAPPIIPAVDSNYIDSLYNQPDSVSPGIQWIRFHVFDSSNYMMEHCPGVHLYYPGTSFGASGQDSIYIPDSAADWLVYHGQTFTLQYFHLLDDSVYIHDPPVDSVYIIQIDADTIMRFIPNHTFTGTCAGVTGSRIRALKE